jgi:tRNA (guanosine-2'-O-)-methyltransferase
MSSPLEDWDPGDVVRILQPFMTADRARKIEHVLAGRTLDVVAVLENIYDRGNISAIMRSAEAFGFSKMRGIESKTQKFKAANRVTKGADKWIDWQSFGSAQEGITDLRSQGYSIWATSLTSQSVDIADVPFASKVAFILGNEADGVSPEALDLCDGNFLVPMVGFSQSFNISVAASVIFYHAWRTRTETLGRSGNLTDKELLGMRADYYFRTVGSAEQILRQAFERR